MQPKTKWTNSQVNANIALRNRLYVSGFLLSGVLKDIRAGHACGVVNIHYEDDIPVGVIVHVTDGTLTDDLSCYYDLMVFVRKSHRNKGIGKKLVNELNVSTDLKVGRGSQHSLNFWHSLGFDIYG